MLHPLRIKLFVILNSPRVGCTSFLIGRGPEFLGGRVYNFLWGCEEIYKNCPKTDLKKAKNTYCHGMSIKFLKIFRWVNVFFNKSFFFLFFFAYSFIFIQLSYFGLPTIIITGYSLKFILSRTSCRLLLWKQFKFFCSCFSYEKAKISW